MFSFQSAALVAGGAFVAGGLLAGIATYELVSAQWEAATAELKIEAAAQLLDAEKNARRKERLATQAKDRLETEYAKTTSSLAATQAENLRLARQLGGLRDPGRRGGSCGGLPSATSTAPGAADTAALNRLSAEATDFLLKFAADADVAASYASTCYNWLRATQAP